MTSAPDVALVPGALALLPEYAGLDDPVAELRAACLEVVGRLGPRVRVVAPGGAGARVAASLVALVGSAVCADSAIAPDEQPTGVLVVGNGSATRTPRAPGHLDERAEAFDDRLRAALTAPDPAALGAIDTGLATQLWADVEGLRALAHLLTPEHVAEVTYDEVPYGVQYWVVRWLTVPPH